MVEGVFSCRDCGADLLRPLVVCRDCLDRKIAALREENDRLRIGINTIMCMSLERDVIRHAVRLLRAEE